MHVVRKQAHALTIVPQHFDETTATAAEHEQMPAMRIALQPLLHHQGQAIKAFAHVGVAGCQPHLDATRDRDHRCRLVFVSALISADTVEASTAPVPLQAQSLPEQTPP